MKLAMESKEIFCTLADEWRRTRKPSWKSKDLVDHDAYRTIIDMGWEAVPFIIGELERQTDHWFHALFAITGIDPILPEHAGVLPRMAEDWIEWWKKHSEKIVP